MRHRQLSALILGGLFLGCLLLVTAGCGADDGGSIGPPSDLIPPAAVTDLAVANGSAGAVTLTWTAPGDDTHSGTAQTYDIRLIPYTGDTTGWEQWQQANGTLPPQQAGATESFTVTGLTTGVIYVFKLKTGDEQPLWSTVSNPVVATAAEQYDTTPPTAVTDLNVAFRSRSRVSLTWTAPGDDGNLGTASQYDLRYATTPITPDNWEVATPATLPDPQNAGTQEDFTVTGLAAETAYYFALRAADEMNIWSDLSNVLPAATNRAWYVTVDGTGDAATIRAACIDSATRGDEILVAPGRYTWSNQGDGNPDYGMIFFPRDSTGITLRSEAGPAETIIDAENQGRVFFLQGQSSSIVVNITIDGFTITGGNTTGSALEEESGGGLIFHLCSPVITNCIFRGNTAVVGGGLTQAGVGSASITDCIFEENVAEFGGGLFLFNSFEGSLISDCVIRNNNASASGGGLYAGNIAFTLENTAIYGNTSDNTGGALTVFDTHPSTVIGCTIADNMASDGGCLRLVGNANLTVSRTILAFARQGGAVSKETDAVLAIGCSDIFGNAGGNNLPSGSLLQTVIVNVDPLFCGGPGTDDYNLQTDSPCAPGQHPYGLDCDLIGAYPVGCGSAP